MAPLAFLIPGDLTLPTGGYAYDRRALALLASQGIAARHVPLPDAYPYPRQSDLDETVRIVQALPGDAVLLIDGLAFGAMPAATIQAFRRPIVALCHHPLGLEAGLTAEQSKAFIACEAAALSRSEAVIVTSPATRALLIAELGVPADRITVAMPGTDPAPRATGTGKPLQLLAVGSIVPRKGYGFLVEALAALSDLDWHLAIVGAEDRSPETAVALRATVAAKGLEDRIAVLGAVDEAELTRQYARADLFVLPSLFEGYGMVLAEAMARGLPIVCTTGGAAAETVPGNAAIKVPPGDANALATALRQMIERPLIRAAKAEAAWVAGSALPRWEDTTRIIADVIRKVEP